MGLYYNNVWDAKKFPFLSQLLYSAESNGTNYIPFNQTAILDANNRVDPKLVAEQGLPFYTATYAVSQLTSNMAITATFVHMLLWCYGGKWPLRKAIVGTSVHRAICLLSHKKKIRSSCKLGMLTDCLWLRRYQPRLGIHEPQRYQDGFEAIDVELEVLAYR